MERHTLIILGGNSSKNKDWLQSMNKYLKLEYVTVEFFYSHWDENQQDINFEQELEKLSKFIKYNNIINYSIVAKSAGFVLSLMGVVRNILTPRTIVGFGLPLEYCGYRNIDIKYLIGTASKKTNAICVQADEDPQGSLKVVRKIISDAIPIWDIKDNTHNYDKFNHMARIAKAFVIIHQPQSEHKIEEINVKSLSDAIEILHKTPQKYRFNNNWLFDIEKEIYIFSHRKRTIILKKGNINKLKKEIENASIISKLIGKVQIGEKKLIVVTPNLYKINSKNGYIFSQYIGPDCNELFYQNTKINITSIEVTSILKVFKKLSIFYKGLLPRNTIITNNKIQLIDLYSVIFNTNSLHEFLQYKTSILIGWRYFVKINDRAIKTIYSYTEDDYQYTKYLDKYEITFKNMLGLMNMNNHQIQKLCYENILKATSYKHIIGLFKIDDILHTISNILPIEIELLIDFLLCEERNQKRNFLYINLSHIIKIARMKSFMEENIKQTKHFIRNEIKYLILEKLTDTNKKLGVNESIIKMIQNSHLEYKPTADYLIKVENFLLT